jgi:hypothetical protein
MAQDTSHNASSRPQRDFPPSQFPQPTLTRIPSPSDLSLLSADELTAPDAAAALTGVHPPEIDMDPESSGHRRRRSSLMNQLDTTVMGKSRDKTSRSPPSGQGGIQEDPKLERASDDERSTSEDVELDELSDDGLQDDEETGLTGKDKGKRKRKRRRNTENSSRPENYGRREERTGSECGEEGLDQWATNRAVVSFLAVDIPGNFSITCPRTLLTKFSTTNGCSHPNTSISTSLYLRLARICSCSSALLPLCCTSSHVSALDTTPSPILKTHIPMRTCNSIRRIARNP